MLVRAARTMPTLVTHMFEDADGEQPATVSAVAATATSAAGGGSSITLPAVTGPVDDVYSVRVPGQAALDQIAITWAATLGDDELVETDLLEIAGGVFFKLGEARAADPELESHEKYPTMKLRQARVGIEAECEAICGRAFVPRYRRVILPGTDDNELLLPDPDVRSIRSAAIITTPGGSATVLTPTELSQLVVNAGARTLTRPVGVNWPDRSGTVVLGYEYGLDAPPEDLRIASMSRMRSWLAAPGSAIPARAETWSDSAGQTYRLTLPEAYEIGIPEIDAVYARYSLRPSSSTGGSGGGVGTSAPAWGFLAYQPQKHSLFHQRG